MDARGWLKASVVAAVFLAWMVPAGRPPEVVAKVGALLHPLIKK